MGWGLKAVQTYLWYPPDAGPGQPLGSLFNNLFTGWPRHHTCITERVVSSSFSGSECRFRYHHSLQHVAIYTGSILRVTREPTAFVPSAYVRGSVVGKLLSFTVSVKLQLVI